MVISAVEKNKARKRDGGVQVCGCVQSGTAREGSSERMICARRDPKMRAWARTDVVGVE